MGMAASIVRHFSSGIGNGKILQIRRAPQTGKSQAERKNLHLQFGNGQDLIKNKKNSEAVNLKTSTGIGESGAVGKQARRHLQRQGQQALPRGRDLSPSPLRPQIQPPGKNFVANATAPALITRANSSTDRPCGIYTKSKLRM